MQLPEAARRAIAAAAEGDGPLVWLTGAGISAESGIPTFRGEEGYWRVGSRNFRPQEMATYAAFREMPEEVWAWYLHRRAVCRGAAPNAGHRALADLEQRTASRFLLVTQNVDGLHLRAGNTQARTYQIHGNIDYLRCPAGGAPRPLPGGIDERWDKARKLTSAELELLRCPDTGELCRPHVLWFDESYDEANFRFESSMEAASSCALLVVVGTTGATNLPMQVGGLVARRGAPMLVINPEPNPFSAMVERSGAGVFLEGNAGVWVPLVADAIADALIR